VASQHLLAMCEAEGVVLRARRGRGPEVPFSRNDFTLHEKHGKLCLIGACLDGFLLTMRSMEYLSATVTFDPLTALSRADVKTSEDGTRGVMFVKRYKGDKTHEWPAKEFSHAVGGALCALAVRLAYEKLNPVPEGADPAAVPYWQLPSGTPVTRARLQSFLQAHMRLQGAPEKRCTSPTLCGREEPLRFWRLVCRYHRSSLMARHDPALRFVNEAAVGLCFHATRWHVVTGCGVGREEVLEGIHYETWLRLVWGGQFRPVLLPPTCAKRMSWAGITLRHGTSCT
jgi:hypothetical protein